MEIGDDDSNAVMKNTRTKVIRLLQEQVSDLQSQKNDVEVLRSKLITTEKALELQEKKYKVKIDDLEYTNSQLVFENQELKELLLKIQSKITPEVKPATFDIEEGVDYAAKARKWKTKYHALAKSDPDSNALFQADKLDVQVKALTAQLEIVKNELDETKAQKQKLVNELAVSNGTLRILKGMVNDVDEKNKELETKNGQIQQQREKAKAEKKHKEILLEHQRQKEEKRKKELAEKTKQAQVEVEMHKQAVTQKEEEVKNLNESMQREIKNRKRAEKKLQQATDNLSAEIDELKQANYKLQRENTALQESLDVISNSSSSIREKFQQLQQEKSDLQDALVKAGRYKTKSVKLENTVSELQNTIKALNGDITQMSAETSNKQDDLKIVISRYYQNHQPGDWQENLDFVSERFEELEDSKKMIEKLNKQIKKHEKTNDGLSNEVSARDKEIESLQSDLQQMQEALQTRGKSFKKSSSSYSNSNQAPNSNHNSAHELDDDSAYHQEIMEFRNALWRRIDSINFKSTNNLREAISLSNKTEITIPSARAVFLSMIFLTRWTHFDRTVPFDPQTILQYSKPGRDLKHISKEAKEIISKLLESNEAMESKIGIASFNHQEQLEHITVLQDSLRAAQKEAAEAIAESDSLRKQVERIASEKAQMVPQSTLLNVQAQLRQRTDELHYADEQLKEMKSEMARLLDTVDSSRSQSDDQQASILSLNHENEELKIRIDEVLRELDLAHTALKEKTKEILSLERRLNRAHGKVAVVKDSIPLSEQPPAASCQLESIKSAFFISDSVRNDLLNMKNKIVNHNEHF